MFELAWSEIALIAVAALIFLGPEDLAKSLFHVGRWLRQLQDFMSGLRSDFNALGYEAEAQALRKKNNAADAATPSSDDTKPPAPPAA